MGVAYFFVVASICQSHVITRLPLGFPCSILCRSGGNSRDPSSHRRNPCPGGLLCGEGSLCASSAGVTLCPCSAKGWEALLFLPVSSEFQALSWLVAFAAVCLSPFWVCACDVDAELPRLSCYRSLLLHLGFSVTCMESEYRSPSTGSSLDWIISYAQQVVTSYQGVILHVLDCVSKGFLPSPSPSQNISAACFLASGLLPARYRVKDYLNPPQLSSAVLMGISSCCILPLGVFS